MIGPNGIGEPIDRKFSLNAVNLRGEPFDEHHAVVFLARDPLLPELLQRYAEDADHAGAMLDVVTGVLLLRDRVLAYQQAHPDRVKVPDIAPEHRDQVVRPNGPMAEATDGQR